MKTASLLPHLILTSCDLRTTAGSSPENQQTDADGPERAAKRTRVFVTDPSSLTPENL